MKVMRMKRIIIDSDIGDDITDVFALVFALKCKELDIKAIISNNGYEKERAQIIHKLVAASGKKIPIFQGVKGGTGRLSNQKEFIQGYKYQTQKLYENVAFFKDLMKKNPNITYVSLGTLTNVNFLLQKVPSIKTFKFLLMAGAVEKDYWGRKKRISEWNIRCDIPSAQKAFATGLNMTMVGLDSTWDLVIPPREIQQLKSSRDALIKQAMQLYKIWRRSHNRGPIEFDSFTIALLLDPSLGKYKVCQLSVNEKGWTIVDKEGQKVKVVLTADKKKFKKLFFEKLLG
jgi:purine nucleosidase